MEGGESNNEDDGLLERELGGRGGRNRGRGRGGNRARGGCSQGIKFVLFYFIFNQHTDLVNRKTSVQWAKEDIAADSAGTPAKLSK